MADWQIEIGIGETRAVLVEGAQIVETRVELEGVVPAGTVITARLVSGGQAGRNAVARDEVGQEYLLRSQTGNGGAGGEVRRRPLAVALVGHCAVGGGGPG